MSRRGTALLLALWLIAALAVASGAALEAARRATATSRNRTLLTRATWARDACIAILRVRFDHSASLRGLDSVDLGNDAWCSAALHDPTTKLNINLASEAQVITLLANDSLAAAVLDWRDPDDAVRPAGAEGPYYRLV